MLGQEGVLCVCVGVVRVVCWGVGVCVFQVHKGIKHTNKMYADSLHLSTLNFPLTNDAGTDKAKSAFHWLV